MIDMFAARQSAVEQAKGEGRQAGLDQGDVDLYTRRLDHQRHLDTILMKKSSQTVHVHRQGL